MQPETLGLLADIRDAARFIGADTADTTYDEFLNDQRMRQAVLYSFLIIGEALNRLRRRDPDIAERIPDLPQIVGMRHALIPGLTLPTTQLFGEPSTRHYPSCVGKSRHYFPRRTGKHRIRLANCAASSSANAGYRGFESSCNSSFWRSQPADSALAT
jgi:uncharacterized protein with HEPN domain